MNIERKTLLEIKPKKDPDEKLKWAMLTSFSIQHKQIQNIVKKHWEVLRQDNILGKLLPGEAKVIFRGAPSLQGQIAPNVTCSTRYVVYLITCPCRKQYIGCTTRTFTTRVGEHIALIKGRDPKHTVPRHYKQFHNSNPAGSQFIIIDKYVPLWRGGARVRGVSRLEMFWAHELQTFSHRA